MNKKCRAFMIVCGAVRPFLIFGERQRDISVTHTLKVHTAFCPCLIQAELVVFAVQDC